MFIIVLFLSTGCKDAPADSLDKGKKAIERKDYKAAVTHLTQAIAEDPKNAEAYYARAWAYFNQKQYDKAIADYNEVIRLNPKNEWAYNDRGNCYKEKKDFQRAIGDYTKAIQLNDQAPEIYDNRAIIYRKLGQFPRVLKEHERALKLSPKHPMTLNDMAWLRATCADAKFRDGKKAVAYAKQACELTEWKNPFYLDTLAAAYAEAGDFRAAVAMQEKALKFPELEEQYGKGPRARLEFYRKRKPYQERIEGKRQESKGKPNGDG
jgi:tetratricopeptide (TPR) repeat protein